MIFMIFMIFHDFHDFFMIFHDFHDFFMKNQKFSKSPKFFAFYLESSKNVLPLRNPLGSARPTQHCPGSLPAFLRLFYYAISRSDVELQNPAHMYNVMYMTVHDIVQRLRPRLTSTRFSDQIWRALCKGNGNLCHTSQDQHQLWPGVVSWLPAVVRGRQLMTSCGQEWSVISINLSTGSL